jgi:toxin ParE1/3/4
MHKVVWTDRSYCDLKSIKEYYTINSEKYATHIIEKIINSSNKISKFPELGRIVPEKQNKLIREVLVFPFRVIYKIHSENIIILTVHHTSRQINIKAIN